MPRQIIEQPKYLVTINDLSRETWEIEDFTSGTDMSDNDIEKIDALGIDDTVDINVHGDTFHIERTS